MCICIGVQKKVVSRQYRLVPRRLTSNLVLSASISPEGFHMAHSTTNPVEAYLHTSASARTYLRVAVSFVSV